MASGHCKTGTGIDAYVAIASEPGIIPTLGPYSSGRFTKLQIACATAGLIIALEKQHPGRFVVLGALHNSPNSAPVKVLGLQKRWIPDLSARSHWIQASAHSLGDDKLNKLIEVEWSTTC